MTKRELDAILAAPLRNDAKLRKLLRAPPAEELDAIARVVIGLSGFFLGRKCKQMAPVLIRRVLAEPIPLRLPATTKEHNIPALTRNLIFLKEAVPRDASDAALIERWREALQVLLDVQSYTWGSKERRAKLVAIARSPHLLAAIQAAVVGILPPADPGRDFMAVLALEGSDASADALMPHLHHAMTTGNGLEQIENLRTYAAKTASMQAMLAKTEQLLDERSAKSPVIELLRRLAIEVDECVFRMNIASVTVRKSVPVVQASFGMESRGVPCFHVVVVRSRVEASTAFDERKIHRDDLELGRAELAAIPQFFARAARKLDIEWDWDGAWIQATLRGRKRDAVERWLRMG